MAYTEHVQYEHIPFVGFALRLLGRREVWWQVYFLFLVVNLWYVFYYCTFLSVQYRTVAEW